ncbi:MAG: polysaccharide pyruvyl transferase family protein, partial [Bacteroidetes bacterium]|nr:polysaccharide pyruvyl transferase family protein [Bacteroidota bacterium]
MIYHIYANRSNIGDWLSAKGIQQLLYPLPITECLCDGPFVSDTIRTISHCKQGDLIVIGGGGLIMDYFEPFWQAFRPLAGRVPYVIWGIGCCDLKQEKSLPSSQLMKEIARQSTLCVVRDQLSRDFLNIASLPAPISCPSLNALTIAPKQEG